MASIEQVATIVDALIEDLEGRRGLGDEWDMLDEDIQEEIRERWIDIISARVG